MELTEGPWKKEIMHTNSSLPTKDMHTAQLFRSTYETLKIKPSKSPKYPGKPSSLHLHIYLYLEKMHTLSRRKDGHKITYPDQEKLSNKRSGLTSKFHHENKYNNNVRFEGVRFICGPHLAIIGPSEARADFNGKVRAANKYYARKMNIITIITHFCEFAST